jgi:uncharacterized protein YggE
MKNIFKIILSFVLIYQSQNCQAQNFTNINAIDVTGNSKMEIIPDRVFVSVTLDERTDVKHVFTYKQQEDSLLSLMKIMQIPKTKIQMKDAGNDYLNVRKLGKSVIAHKTYLIELQNVKQLNTLFSKLDRWMVYKAWIEKVDHSKIDSLKKQGQIAAITNAQEKAKYLLSPLGKSIGNVLYVSDIQDLSIGRTFNYIAGANVRSKWSGGEADMAHEETPANDVDFETMKLEYQVTVKFEIK